MNRRSLFASLFAAPLAKHWKPKAVAWHESPDIPVHPTGVSVVGDLHVGDLLTFEGKYAFNPKTRKQTDRLQLFIVTAVDSQGLPVVRPHYSRRPHIQNYPIEV